MEPSVIFGLVVIFAPFFALLFWLNRHQQRAAAREMADRGPCPRCKRPALVVTSRISASGWVLIVVGLFLSPVVIGLFLIAMGMRRKDTRAVCGRCRAVAYAMA